MNSCLTAFPLSVNSYTPLRKPITLFDNKSGESILPSFTASMYDALLFSHSCADMPRIPVT